MIESTNGSLLHKIIIKMVCYIDTTCSILMSSPLPLKLDIDFLKMIALTPQMNKNKWPLYLMPSSGQLDA